MKNIQYTIFATIFMVIICNCDKPSKILYINNDSLRVLHSPSIDRDGNILFGASILKNQGWWVDSTKWYLLDYSTLDYTVLPFDADHAYLSFNGKYIVYSGNDFNIYKYSLTEKTIYPVNNGKYMTADSSFESYVSPIISNNGDYIFTRSTIYEFYFEDIVLFKKFDYYSYMRLPISEKYLLSPESVYFTQNGKYLITCGSNFGAEIPTGFSLFNLKNADISKYVQNFSASCCHYDEKEQIIFGVDFPWYENNKYNTIIEKYSIISDSVLSIYILEPEQIDHATFNHSLPLVSYITDSKLLIAFDYLKLEKTILDTLKYFEYQPKYFPKLTWIPNSKNLIVATDKLLVEYNIK